MSLNKTKEKYLGKTLKCGEDIYEFKLQEDVDIINLLGKDLVWDEGYGDYDACLRSEETDNEMLFELDENYKITDIR